MEERNYDGKTLLLQACDSGNIHQIRNCLQNGANPHATAGGGGAIHWLLTNRYIIKKENLKEGISLLLDAGCKIDFPNSEGKTPLISSFYFGDLETATVLIDFGANPECTNKEGKIAHEIIGDFYRNSKYEFTAIQKKEFYTFSLLKCK